MADATAQLRAFARLKNLRTDDRKWRARAIVFAAQWFYMPQASNIAQCRLARASALALVHAIAQQREAPEWFTRAVRCAAREH